MPKKKPRAGHGAGQGLRKSGPQNIAEDLAQNQVPSPAARAPAPTVDLVALRERLFGARRRLVERLVEDFPADRRFPDSGWTRMLADIHIAIAAVDAVAAEDGP